MKAKEHQPGCPRLQFWDAGEWEAPCTCRRRRSYESVGRMIHRNYPIPAPKIPTKLLGQSISSRNSTSKDARQEARKVLGIAKSNGGHAGSNNRATPDFRAFYPMVYPAQPPNPRKGGNGGRA